MSLPELSAAPGIGELGATAASIAALQRPSGFIPWSAAGHGDPWNHLEAALALAVVGDGDGARRALDFLAATQRPDGSWHAGYCGDGEIDDDRLDTNGTAYVATGVLGCALALGEGALVRRHLAMMRRALDFVLAQQRPSGAICWSDAPAGAAGDLCLLAACSSIYASLTAWVRAAALIGVEPATAPEVAPATHRLRDAIVARPECFADKREYAMDWYYPVLAGVLEGDAARQRLASGWERFVQPGRGVLCRSDHRWITTAETAECALACLRCGLVDEAAALLALAEHQRQTDGSYLTGLVYPERSPFPAGERTSYSAAAVVLAADALRGGVTAALFGAPSEPGAW
ncbi:MAG: prenyltransferase [Actinomycetota bacterium]|nr:prenyltransferase [Actinomycetota bacterium]